MTIKYASPTIAQALRDGNVEQFAKKTFMLVSAVAMAIGAPIAAHALAAGTGALGVIPAMDPALGLDSLSPVSGGSPSLSMPSLGAPKPF
jgi:hypothetical protein